jgi:hypothetical protein
MLRLEPYVDIDALRRMRVVTGAPGRWLPVVLRARATTLGPFVFFRAGAFDPSTPRGLALIAHEALHTVQYREMGVPRFLARYVLEAVRVRFDHGRHPLEAPLIARQREIRRALEVGSEEGRGQRKEGEPGTGDP